MGFARGATATAGKRPAVAVEAAAGRAPRRRSSLRKRLEIALLLVPALVVFIGFVLVT